MPETSEGELPHVPEKSSARLRLKFYDPDGELEAPTSGTYTVLDLASGTKLIDDDPISGIDSVVDIWLTPTENTIQDDTKEWEVRRVVVTGTYNASDAIRSQFDYIVDNLSVIT